MGRPFAHLLVDSKQKIVSPLQEPVEIRKTNMPFVFDIHSCFDFNHVDALAGEQAHSPLEYFKVVTFGVDLQKIDAINSAICAETVHRFRPHIFKACRRRRFAWGGRLRQIPHIWPFVQNHLPCAFGRGHSEPEARNSIICVKGAL